MMRLRSRFILAFAVTALATYALGVSLLSTQQRIQKAYMDLEKSFIPSLQALMDIRIALIDLEAAIDNADSESERKTARKAIEVISQNRDTHGRFLESIEPRNHEERHLHEINGDIDAVIAAARAILDESRSVDSSHENRGKATFFKAANKSLSIKIDNLIGVHKKALRTAQAQVREQHALGERVVWLGIGMSMFAAIGAGVYMSRTVLTPLMALRRGAQRIGKGNLDFRLNINTGDELEQLARDINDMAAHLNEDQHRIVQAERHAAIGQAIGQILHSMKNILNIFSGGRYMVNIALQKHNPELLESGWGIVQSGMDRMSKLSNDILSYSRNDSIKTTENSLNEIAAEVAGALTETASKTNVEVDFIPGGDIPLFLFDSMAAHTAAMNLATNALDACRNNNYPLGKKGIIRIETRYHKESGTASLIVADNGPGIPKEIQDKIFTAFFTTKCSHGNGLGLSITMKIMEDHGGDIRLVKSCVGDTVFELVFPVRHKSFAIFRKDSES